MRSITKPIVITWDYKEQPDWDEVNFALCEQVSAFVHPVESGTDQFAIVIGFRDLTAEQAQARYDSWYQSGGDFVSIAEPETNQ